MERVGWKSLNGLAHAPNEFDPRFSVISCLVEPCCCVALYRLVQGCCQCRAPVELFGELWSGWSTSVLLLVVGLCVGCGSWSVCSVLVVEVLRGVVVEGIGDVSGCSPTLWIVYRPYGSLEGVNNFGTHRSHVQQSSDSVKLCHLQ